MMVIAVIFSQEGEDLFDHEVLLVLKGAGVAELVEALALLGHDHSPLAEGLVLDLAEWPEQHVLVTWIDQRLLVHVELTHQHLHLSQSHPRRTVQRLPHLVVLRHHPQRHYQQRVHQGELMGQPDDGRAQVAVVLETLVELDELSVHGFQGGADESGHFGGEVGEVEFGLDGLDLCEFGEEDVHVVGVLLAHEERQVEEAQGLVAFLLEDERGGVALQPDQLVQVRPHVLLLPRRRHLDHARQVQLLPIVHPQTIPSYHTITYSNTVHTGPIDHGCIL